MKELLRKKLQERKKKGNEKGFTLVEILVVLVIMGFLVAMVAPKLANVSDYAKNNIDEQSQKHFNTILHDWIKMKDSIPPGLANLCATDHTTGAMLPANFLMASIDDGDSTNGAEVLNKEFVDNWIIMPHRINGAEAAELGGMIGGAVMNYELVTTTNLLDTDTNFILDSGGQANILERYLRKPLKANQIVMMIGGGWTDATTCVWGAGPAVTVTGSAIAVSPSATASVVAAGQQLITSSNYYSAGTLTYAQIGEGTQALRIVMGMTDRNQLVNTGMLDNAGISPYASQSDNYEFGNYFVVIPRLQATVDRFLDVTNANLAIGAVPASITAAYTDGYDHVVQHSVAYNEDENGIYTLVARTPHRAVMAGSPPAQVDVITSGVNLGKQDLSSTFVLSPEGEKWAAQRSDWFGVAIAHGHGKVVL